MDKDAAPGFKSGFVALLGRPNAGKSTLLNALLRFPLSIVSPQPQTTRHKILGLLNGKDYQICFLDTPGLLDQAKDLLQGALIRAARQGAREDADIVLVLAEPKPADPGELEKLRALLPAGKPVILAVNKTDMVPPAAAQAALASYASLSPARAHAISALKSQGLDALMASIMGLLPLSPPYYSQEQLSDRWERFFVTEIIRQGLFELYRQEVPHACAVEIEDFKEKPGRKDLIRAVIYVERPNQKGILLGKSGRALRELHKSRLKAIESFLGRRVEIELWVKVKANWRKDPNAIRAFGYAP